MFDEIIYKVLDKIETTCKCIKEVIKNRSLPEACYRKEARNEEVKKWAKSRKNDYK